MTSPHAQGEPVLGALLDLVLPRSCVGCGAEAVSLCPACRAALAGVRPAPAMVAGVPVVGAATYRGVVREALLEFKERGQPQLGGALSELLAVAVDVAVPGCGALLLVPVPSGRGLLAGIHPVDELAAATARRLRARRPARVWRPAATVRGRLDQVGLDDEQRRANLERSMTVRGRIRRLPGDVVVVDDILTTGSTLAELVRALRSAGVEPRAGAVVAVARPGTSSNWRKQAPGVRGDPDDGPGAIPRHAH